MDAGRCPVRWRPALYPPTPLPSHLLGQGEGVVGLHGDGQHVLVAVDEGVGHRGDGGEVQLQAGRGNVAQAAGDVAAQVVVGDVQHLPGRGGGGGVRGGPGRRDGPHGCAGWEAAAHVGIRRSSAYDEPSRAAAAEPTAPGRCTTGRASIGKPAGKVKALASGLATGGKGRRGRTLGSYSEPLSYTCWMIRPYEKGLMPSLDSRVASEAPTCGGGGPCKHSSAHQPVPTWLAHGFSCCLLRHEHSPVRVVRLCHRAPSQRGPSARTPRNGVPQLCQAPLAARQPRLALLTLSPVLIRCTSAVISTEPLLILVGMFSTWWAEQGRRGGAGEQDVRRGARGEGQPARQKKCCAECMARALAACAQHAGACWPLRHFRLPPSQSSQKPGSSLPALCTCRAIPHPHACSALKKRGKRPAASGLPTPPHPTKHAHTWKNEVWEGSMPVLPAGMVTSLGATRPTRAGAPTLNSLITLRTCTGGHGAGPQGGQRAWQGACAAGFCPPACSPACAHGCLNSNRPGSVAGRKL